MALLDVSPDVSDDESSDVQRFSNTLVRSLAPPDALDALPTLELSACARLECVAATALYCCTCCDAFGCCGKGASAALLVSVSSPDVALRGAGTNPSCITALAIADASTFALSVDAPVAGEGATDSCRPFLASACREAARLPMDGKCVLLMLGIVITGSIAGPMANPILPCPPRRCETASPWC